MYKICIFFTFVSPQLTTVIYSYNMYCWHCRRDYERVKKYFFFSLSLWRTTNERQAHHWTNVSRLKSFNASHASNASAAVAASFVASHYPAACLLVLHTLSQKYMYKYMYIYIEKYKCVYGQAGKQATMRTQHHHCRSRLVRRHGSWLKYRCGKMDIWMMKSHLLFWYFCCYYCCYCCCCCFYYYFCVLYIYKCM